MRCGGVAPRCFFQEEDGIRDGRVTGVQTCALPIWRQHGAGLVERHGRRLADGTVARLHARSEERRVGKEWRSRWSPDHLKKKRKVKTATGVVCVGGKTQWTSSDISTTI